MIKEDYKELSTNPLHIIFVGDKNPDGCSITPVVGHFTEDCKPEGFDIKQVFVTPSLKYCTYGNVYARKCRYT